MFWCFPYNQQPIVDDLRTKGAKNGRHNDWSVLPPRSRTKCPLRKDSDRLLICLHELRMMTNVWLCLSPACFFVFLGRQMAPELPLKRKCSSASSENSVPTFDLHRFVPLVLDVLCDDSLDLSSNVTIKTGLWVKYFTTKFHSRTSWTRAQCRARCCSY